jgi:hypothetical protein
MNATLKTIFTLSIPMLVIGAIFNATVLKAYIGAKHLEQAKLARVALENVSRAPAVVANR